jgi:hypothetical protein
MPGGESAGRSLAMHIDCTEFWMRFVLHEIMADLVEQFQLAAEHAAEGGRYLLEDD